MRIAALSARRPSVQLHFIFNGIDLINNGLLYCRKMTTSVIIPMASYYKHINDIHLANTRDQRDNQSLRLTLSPRLKFCMRHGKKQGYAQEQHLHSTFIPETSWPWDNSATHHTTLKPYPISAICYMGHCKMKFQ